MSSTSLFYWNEQLPKNQARTVEFQFSISDAKTISPIVKGHPIMYGFDAASFASQAAIDAHLGTTNEFLLAAFDSTSLGTDAFAVIVNMSGQADKLVYAELISKTGTGGATVAENCVAAGTLNSSSLSVKAAKGANGNLAARFVSSGLDSVTSGVLIVRFHFISK